MAVSLIVSKLIAGAAVADTLAGGGTGLDYGNVTNGSYAPLTTQSANTGAQDFFVRANSTTDPVTAIKLYIVDYTTTGATWGGGNISSAADLTALTSLGSASSSSKNNNDGLSGGLWTEVDWTASTTNQFDLATRPSRVLVFGKNGVATVTGSPDNSAKNGTTSTLAFDVGADANSYYNGTTEADATTPVNGQLAGTGQITATQAVLGNRLHLRNRIYIPTSFADGGIFQFAHALQFSFTSALCFFMIMPMIGSHLS